MDTLKINNHQVNVRNQTLSLCQILKHSDNALADETANH